MTTNFTDSTDSTKKIAVVGAGGTGSVIGGMLTVAGHDVVMIDQWGAHVEAMKAHGLHMSIAGEEFTSPVRALHPACRSCSGF